jgi:hypothetical protein
MRLISARRILDSSKRIRFVHKRQQNGKEEKMLFTAIALRHSHFFDAGSNNLV